MKRRFGEFQEKLIKLKNDVKINGMINVEKIVNKLEKKLVYKLIENGEAVEENSYKS